MSKSKPSKTTAPVKPPGRARVSAESQLPDLLFYESRYAGGDRVFLFVAIEHCIARGEDPPQWVRTALSTGVDRYTTGEVETLDDAFGVQRTERASTARKKRQRKPGEPFTLIAKLAFRVNELVQEGLGWNRATYAAALEYDFKDSEVPKVRAWVKAALDASGIRPEVKESPIKKAQ